MSYITSTELTLDAKILASEYNVLYNSMKADQINLRKPHHLSDIEGLVYGSGSLMKEGKVYDNDRSWDSFITSLEGTYTIDSLKEVEKYVSKQYNAKIGRARYMRLTAKSCLTYHTDQDNIMRLHIPIITNANCFFVNNDTIGRMPDVGRVYVFDSTIPHTAVNASRESRVHIVINCYI